jgi:hypothetical protein
MVISVSEIVVIATVEGGASCSAAVVLDVPIIQVQLETSNNLSNEFTLMGSG